MMAIDLFDEYSENELRLQDIQHYGLNQLAWDYSRGARTERLYVDLDNADKIRIKDSYIYTMSNGDRDIATVSRKIEWFKQDDTVGLEKNLIKQYTVKSLGQLNRDIRIGRLTDLRENAKGLPGGQLIVDSLYSWYGDEMFEYEDIGSLAFEDALKAEADVSRLGLLNTSIPEFGGATIMQLLSFQLIGSYSWP